jgi:RND superfamily putative drug exporter
MTNVASTQEMPTTVVDRPLEIEAIKSSRLYRWGVAVARRRRVVLGIAVLVTLICAGAYPALQKELGAPSAAIAGSQSARVEQLVERIFPLGSEYNVVVFDSPSHVASDSAYRSVIAAVDKAVAGQKGVRTVQGPYDPDAEGQILENEHVAFSLVTVGGSAEQRLSGTERIQAAVAHARGAHGVNAWLTGPSPLVNVLSSLQKSDSKRALSIAFPIVLLILILAMGALVAAMLPLLMATAGLLLAFGVLAVLARLFHFDTFLLAMVSLIGPGLSIDYALFVTSRFREELARSSPDQDESERVANAVGVALATSGRTILFSGVIVMFALSALFSINSDFFHEVALAAIVVVLSMLLTATTLLPAVLAALGSRVNAGALPARLQPADARPSSGAPRPGRWARWAQLVMRRPVPVLLGTGVLLLVLANPALHLNSGFNLDLSRVSDAPPVEGQKTLERAFSPGVSGPIEIVISGRGGHDAGAVSGAGRLRQELEGDQRITAVHERRGGAGILLTAIPSVQAHSTVATQLVEHIRNDLAPPLEAHTHVAVFVGGPSAQAVDGINELNKKFPLILTLILVPSLLFLLVVFRSIALPIKAVLMNLLATGATIGLVVWVFQYGHGQNLLNFSNSGIIQVTVPVIMFALLFGLSMDYEVFLIRRVQEEWRRTGDNTTAVASGIEHTGRPITAAAAVMATIFASFVLGNLLELKQLGFALAVAVLLDATLIRLVLVPATMRLLGKWNWWLPVWLARRLPSLGVD